GLVEGAGSRAEARAERWAHREEQRVSLPKRLPPAVGADGVDRAGERVRDVEHAPVVLRDGVRRKESFGEDREEAGSRIDPDESAAAGEGRVVVVSDVDALWREALAEERVAGRDRQAADLVTTQVGGADG